MNASNAAAAGAASKRRRRFAGVTIAVGAIAAGLVLSAPVAHAGESDVETWCTGWRDGTYHKDSNGVETCCFEEAIDADGHHCEVYVAGERVGSILPNDPPPKPDRAPHKAAPGGVAPPSGSTNGQGPTAVSAPQVNSPSTPSGTETGGTTTTSGGSETGGSTTTGGGSETGGSTGPAAPAAKPKPPARVHVPANNGPSSSSTSSSGGLS
jgi:hypothetical protein